METACGHRGREAVVALVALVAVLALAGVAYGLLSGQLGQVSRDGQSAGAGGTGASAVAGNAGSADANDADALMLASIDAEVEDAGGAPLFLAQIADGKPLVVNFWATWCPYCVQEMGDFQELVDEYGDRVAFAFVDYADGERETVDKAAAWLADNGYDLPAYYDTTGRLTSSFGVRGFPTTAVVSADGEVLAITPGAIDVTLMREALGSLAGE